MSLTAVSPLHAVRPLHTLEELPMLMIRFGAAVTPAGKNVLSVFPCVQYDESRWCTIGIQAATE
jgi:hypothetical protein